MTRHARLAPLATILLAGLLPAFAAAQDAAAAGDPAKGEADFNRQCTACHVVADASGQVLAGRNGHTGPNLHGVVGRVPGTYPDFDYGESMVAYGATGVVWAQENFVAYVQDPTPFLRAALQDPSARGKMSYKVRKEEDARDLYAFLATFSTPADAAATDAAPTDATPTEGAAAPGARLELRSARR